MMLRWLCSCWGRGFGLFVVTIRVAPRTRRSCAGSHKPVFLIVGEVEGVRHHPSGHISVVIVPILLGIARCIAERHVFCRSAKRNPGGISPVTAWMWLASL